VVAGQVIADPIVRIFFQGAIAAEIPATALADNTPIYHRELLETPPDYAQIAWQWQADQLPPATLDGIDINGEPQTWNQILLTLLDSPSIASKRWVYRQYDHQVQNNTVILPGGADAAVVRVRPIDASPLESSIGVAATTDCNARYVYLNPLEGAKAAVAEAARNLSCVGAEPLAVTDNLNFGSPENPVGYWQLALACQGIAEACRALDTPVTGGNVSLYNETLDSEGKPQAIYPTPVIGMVGRVADITKVVGQGWRNTGEGIYLLGSNDHNTLGGSDYLALLHHTVAGQPPQVDFELEKAVQAACRHGIAQGWIIAAHDCAEGGLGVALAEMAIAGKLGAEIVINPDRQRLDQLLFGEAASRIVVSVHPQFQPAWEQYLQANLNNTWQKLGVVGTNLGHLTILNADNTAFIDLDLATLTEPWETAIARRLGLH
ncbi:MAG: AIR synthase related protein, partial [Synechocystis sp.]